MADRGARRFYAKRLKPNDNSKNQPYFGRGDFSALNILPMAGPPRPDARRTGANALRVPLAFSWLADDGKICPAPHAKLILYPQYPEIRFSGFLRACDCPPTRVMGATRAPGRLLIIGISDGGQLIGYAADADSAVARELHSLGPLAKSGVFLELPNLVAPIPTDDRTALLAALCAISTKSWIDACKLASDGGRRPYAAQNAGGFTLEAELGIAPNSRCAPDYRGWEIKQYGVRDFTRYSGGAITLMTPEPKGGIYATAGFEYFTERYGYLDRLGRTGRINFGGVHRANATCALTGLKLVLTDYDQSRHTFRDPNGGIALLEADGTVAALWRYTDLLVGWNRKHALAAYVPSMSRRQPITQYRYASRITLGEGTDFGRFLAAVAAGVIYYDPGMKIEGIGGETPVKKKRNQFRIRYKGLNLLYRSTTLVDACSATTAA